MPFGHFSLLDRWMDIWYDCVWAFERIDIISQSFHIEVSGIGSCTDVVFKWVPSRAEISRSSGIIFNSTHLPLSSQPQIHLRSRNNGLTFWPIASKQTDTSAFSLAPVLTSWYVCTASVVLTMRRPIFLRRSSSLLPSFFEYSRKSNQPIKGLAR